MLAEIPDCISKLTQLQELDISHNDLAEIPSWIGRLTQLRFLNVNGNRLTVLPESIGKLARLIGLDVGRNKLTALPESLGRLRNLRHLCASENQLTSLPESLSNIKSLDALYLFKNNKLALPREIVGPDWAARVWRSSDLDIQPPSTRPAVILDYYRRTQRGQRALNEAKLILVGRGGVGKTCLIKRMLFDTFNEHEPETPGIEILPWEVRLADGDSARLHVWDFGGQEILHATHQFFLTERTLYLLVLSGREGTPTHDAEYWLQLIKSFGGESPVLVALNKSAQHSFELNRSMLLEKYPFIKGFIVTDCDKDIGINELRQFILRQTEALEHRKVAFPADWFSIKERLARMKENFLTRDQYQEICRSMGEQDAEAQRQLADFLHILGIALNYRDDPRLNDTHVLNPRWVTEGIYTLLRAGQKARREGVLTKIDLSLVLNPKIYPEACHAFLLHLMEKFQLCFRLPGSQEQYLVPELLGENQPDLKTLLNTPGLGFRYQYEVWPEGLLPRFIVQTHAHSNSNPGYRWRTGVVLHREGCHAVVRADVRERRVDIHITGNQAQRRGLLAVIREKFDEQHRDLKGLTVDERVPIPDEPGVTVSYSHLLMLEEDGDTWFRPEGTRQKVCVTDLLNGVESRKARSARRSSQTLAPAEIPRQRSTIRPETNITIGIVTALPKEFAAMRAALDDWEEHHIAGSGAGRRYVLGRVPSLHGRDHRVALALADMGNNSAAARATLLLEHYGTVDAIIMVGIAGGVPCPDKSDDHVRLGDIVVSNKQGVIQYDMVKLKKVRACPIPPSARLVEAVRLLSANEIAGERAWDRHITAIIERLNISRPPSTRDQLHATSDPSTPIKHPKDPKRLKGLPRVFLGPIASANELLKKPAKRDSLRNKFGVKAVEMEGSGIADATWESEKGYLVVRGVCDYCDMHKGDEWQDYAAVVAAGYTRALIESMFVTNSPARQQRRPNP